MDTNSIGMFIVCLVLAFAVVMPFMFEQRGYQEDEWED